MQTYNPANEDHIGRLREAMEWSQKKLDPFQKRYVRSLRQYVGHHYGDGGTAEKVPVNVLRLAVDVYQRQLAARPPKAMVLTHSRNLRAAAYELELATNHVINEIRLVRTLREAVKSALFQMGVIKVGITSSGMDESLGWQHDAGQVFCDSVLFDDWLHDMTARRPEEWGWCGNRYRIPLEDVMMDPGFDEQAKRGLKAAAYSPMSRLDSEHRSSISRGDDLAEEYVDHVDLWDIWIPRENLVITLTDDDSKTPLRIIEWEGPEHGPYHILSFGQVPGNIIPATPINHLFDLHDIINRIFLQLGRQAERQKTITLVGGPAAQDGTGERIVETEDGGVVRTDHPDAAREMRYGGADQANMAFALMLMDRFSYLGGNIDVLGGLSQQGSTLGQEKILHESSSTLVSEMRDQVIEFAKGVITDTAYYVYTDPFAEIPLTKVVEGTEFEIPFVWTPDRRQHDFYEFAFEIEPFSTQSRSPAERLQQLLQLVTQVVIPLGPLMQQMGIGLDFESLLSLIAKYSDLPEFGQMIKLAGGELPPVPGAGGPAALPSPKQSPVTTRNYVRENVSGGGGGQDPGRMIEQLLAGAGRVQMGATAA